MRDSPLILSGKLMEAAAFITPTITEAPAMSALISSIPRGAFKHKPPLSNVRPLPKSKCTSFNK